jgi:hypothetical protein
MSSHRRCYTSEGKKDYKIYKAFAELGVDKFYIERLEEFPCNDVQALVSREGHYMRLYNSVHEGLNGKFAGETDAEYYRQNRRSRYASDPEYREKTLERTRNYMESKKMDPDYLAHRRETIRQYRLNEHVMEKRREYNRKYMENKRATNIEYLEKHRDYNRKYLADKRANDPEFQELKKKYDKEYYEKKMANDPEYREREKIRKREYMAHKRATKKAQAQKEDVSTNLASDESFQKDDAANEK